MAKQIIVLGSVPTGYGGDTPRSAFTKVNANFDELYTRQAQLGSASNLNAGTAAGNVMPVGTGGLLGLSTPAISSTGTLPGFSSQYYTSGTQYVAFDGEINQHFTNRFDDGVNAVTGIIAMGGLGSTGTEPKVGVKLVRMTPGTGNSIASTVWRYLYHTGNTTRAADGTLKAI